MTERLANLAENGSSDWSLYLPDGSGKVERFAAEEFGRYIREMSGARLRPGADPDAVRTVVIGLRGRLDLRNSPLPAPKPGHDGYSVFVGPDRIVVAGDNPRGVLYGVYDLLERLGCRWYYPTLDPKDPEVVPRNPDLSLPCGAWAEAGAVEDRFYWISGLAFSIVPGHAIPQLDWAAKNRFNGLSWQCVIERLDEDLAAMRETGIFAEMEKRGLMFDGPGHCFPHFLSTEAYFEDHPDWFGFRNGKRQPHGGTWPATNFCMGNPGAVEQFIANVLEFAARYPEIKRLDMVPIDGGRPCECETCSRSTPTDLMVRLFNELSDRLETVAPGVVLGAVPGYCPIEKAPSEEILNGKWQGIYAHWGRNHVRSYDDPNYGRRPNLLVWRSYFRRFWICSYYAANSHQPFIGPPYLHAIEGDTRFLVEQGITGAFVLEYPFSFWWNNAFNIRMAGLHPYYYPKRGPREELRDFALHYFGPVAGPILAEYYEMLGSNENLESSYRAHRGEASDGDMEWFRDMNTMIERAAALAADDPVVSYRVSKLALGMEMLLDLGPSRRLVIEAETALEEFRQGLVSRETVEAKAGVARARMEELAAAAERRAAADNGVIAEKWIKSWTLDRTFRGALDRIDKELQGAESAVRPKKPDHVVDTDL